MKRKGSRSLERVIVDLDLVLVILDRSGRAISIVDRSRSSIDLDRSIRPPPPPSRRWASEVVVYRYLVDRSMGFDLDLGGPKSTHSIRHSIPFNVNSMLISMVSSIDLDLESIFPPPRSSISISDRFDHSISIVSDRWKSSIVESFDHSSSSTLGDGSRHSTSSHFLFSLVVISIRAWKSIDRSRRSSIDLDRSIILSIDLDRSIRFGDLILFDRSIDGSRSVHSIGDSSFVVVFDSFVSSRLVVVVSASISSRLGSSRPRRLRLVSSAQPPSRLVDSDLVGLVSSCVRPRPLVFIHSRLVIHLVVDSTRPSSTRDSIIRRSSLRSSISIDRRSIDRSISISIVDRRSSSSSTSSISIVDHSRSIVDLDLGIIRSSSIVDRHSSFVDSFIHSSVIVVVVGLVVSSRSFDLVSLECDGAISISLVSISGSIVILDLDLDLDLDRHSIILVIRSFSSSMENHFGRSKSTNRRRHSSINVNHSAHRPFGSRRLSSSTSSTRRRRRLVDSSSWKSRRRRRRRLIRLVGSSMEISSSSRLVDLGIVVDHFGLELVVVDLSFRLVVDSWKSSHSTLSRLVSRLVSLVSSLSSFPVGSLVDLSSRLSRPRWRPLDLDSSLIRRLVSLSSRLVSSSRPRPLDLDSARLVLSSRLVSSFIRRLDSCRRLVSSPTLSFRLVSRRRRRLDLDSTSSRSRPRLDLDLSILVSTRSRLDLDSSISIVSISISIIRSRSFSISTRSFSSSIVDLSSRLERPMGDGPRLVIHSLILVSTHSSSRLVRRLVLGSSTRRWRGGSRPRRRRLSSSRRPRLVDSSTSARRPRLVRPASASSALGLRRHSRLRRRQSVDSFSATSSTWARSFVDSSIIPLDRSMVDLDLVDAIDHSQSMRSSIVDDRSSASARRRSTSTSTLRRSFSTAYVDLDSTYVLDTSVILVIHSFVISSTSLRRHSSMGGRTADGGRLISISFDLSAVTLVCGGRPSSRRCSLSTRLVVSSSTRRRRRRLVDSSSSSSSTRRRLILVIRRRSFDLDRHSFIRSRSSIVDRHSRSIDRSIIKSIDRSIVDLDRHSGPEVIHSSIVDLNHSIGLNLIHSFDRRRRQSRLVDRRLSTSMGSISMVSSGLDGLDLSSISMRSRRAISARSRRPTSISTQLVDLRRRRPRRRHSFSASALGLEAARSTYVSWARRLRPKLVRPSSRLSSRGLDDSASAEETAPGL